MPDDYDLRFKAARVNGRDEVVARAVNLTIGPAAFETARRLYEGERVDCNRDGARLIARSEPDGQGRASCQPRWRRSCDLARKLA